MCESVRQKLVYTRGGGVSRRAHNYFCWDNIVGPHGIQQRCLKLKLWLHIQIIGQKNMTQMSWSHMKALQLNYYVMILERRLSLPSIFKNIKSKLWV